MRTYCLENINPEELEALQSQIAGDEENLNAQKDMLEENGTISRDQAEEIKDDLPDDIVMESFTQLPTKTNYGMALESVNAALTVAALAGALVVGVGVVHLLKKIGDTKVKTLSKNAAPNEIKAVVESGAQAVEKQSPEIKTGVYQRLDDSKINNLVYALLLGDPSRQIKDTCHSLLSVDVKDTRRFLQDFYITPMEQVLNKPLVDAHSPMAAKRKEAADAIVKGVCMALSGGKETSDLSKAKGIFHDKWLAQASPQGNKYLTEGKLSNVDMPTVVDVNRVSESISQACNDFAPTSDSLTKKLNAAGGTSKEIAASVKDSFRDIDRVMHAMDVFVVTNNSITAAVNQAVHIYEQLQKSFGPK